jgi:autotransporter-associated beta strand protein
LVDSQNDCIADIATVSVFSTGFWQFLPQFNHIETITNLNIVSTGIAAGGLVTISSGRLRLLGSMTMTSGTVNTTSTGALLLNGNLTTNVANIVASISTRLDLGNAMRTLTVADGAVLNDLDVTGVVSNGGIIKDGPGTLRLGVANTYNLGTTLSGTFAVEGPFNLGLSSALNGDITKTGTGTLVFATAGSITDSLTINAGAIRVDAPVTFANSLTNSATILFGTQTLTVNGAGIDNQDSLPLAGGTLAGSGPVMNNGLISGYGTIGGTGGFTNNAQLTVSGGNISLANVGANANAGNVSVPAGLQLRLTGNTLANTGTIDLAGGIVAGTATLSNNAGGAVSGSGTISAPFANAGGTLRVVGGTMNVTSAFANSGEIFLGGGLATLGGAGAITNTGLIRGEGKISKAINNNAGGQLRADPGKSLTFTGSGNTNSGQINLYGGLLEFTQNLTNNAGGFISGNGTLIVGNGLSNNGTMNFSGSANVAGDAINAVGAKIISSGGGPTTFFDDVANQGEIRTSAGSFTVFFGSVSGTGSYAGPGTVNFEGDLKPGNSPADVQFAGDVVLGTDATLQIEIGGITPGTQYDRLTIAGSASLDGALDVSLINGFTPNGGQQFTILTAGNIVNNGLVLGGSGASSFSLLVNSTSVILQAIGLAGDYNHNGFVDAADYVVWRKNPGGFPPDGYATWRSHFGEPPGIGSSSAGASPSQAAIPEPATLVLLVSAAAGWCLRRRRNT